MAQVFLPDHEHRMDNVMNLDATNPMRKAVRDGILAAMQTATAPSGNARRGLSRLAGLTEKEVDALIVSTLSALAELPAPGPQLAVTADPIPAATPVLVLTPADVVASAATAALAERDYDTTSGLDVTYGNEAGYIEEKFTPPLGHVTGLRRLAWTISSMFGVSVRTWEASNQMAIYGPRAQVRGLRRSLDTLASIGVPMTANLTDEDVETFWRTVGVMIAQTERAQLLTQSNDAQRTAVSEWVNTTYGKATIVPTNAAATEGALFNAASRVVSEQATRAFA